MVNTHSAGTKDVPPSIWIRLKPLPLHHPPQQPKRRRQGFGLGCGKASLVKRRRLNLSAHHVVRASVLEDDLIPAERPRVVGMTVAVTAAGKIAEQMPIPTGVGVKTTAPSQSRERADRVQVAGRQRPGINPQGVLAAAGVVRAVSEMEIGRYSRIRPLVQGMHLATFRETRRLPRRAPRPPRTPEMKKPEQPGNRVLIAAYLGATNE